MAQKIKKTIIIIGGNSSKNKLWVDRTTRAYSGTYDVVPFYFRHWETDGEDIDFTEELRRLSSVLDQLDEYIIIAKSAGALLALMGMSSNRLSPLAFVAYGVPIEYARYRRIDTRKLYISIHEQCPVLVLQQVQDPQGSAAALKRLLPPWVPVISISGDDHAYDNVVHIKKYSDAFIDLNTQFVPRKITARSLVEAVCEVDTNRKIFKYYNYWLSDPSNRILSFVFRGKQYVIKRVTKHESTEEVRNAKLLQKSLDGLVVKGRTVAVQIPCTITTKSNRTYLLSEYFGEDLNQSYYSKKGGSNAALQEITATLWDKMISDGIIYNGFLPRNMIISDSSIHLIDFEDINRKSKIVAETSYCISWSYFASIDLNSKLMTLSNDTYRMLYKKITNNTLRENPYSVAYQAESVGSGFKLDDIICNLSQYISPEIEMLLDILLNAERKEELFFALAARLRGISEEARTIGAVVRKEKVVNLVLQEIYAILQEILNDNLATRDIRSIIRYNIRKIPSPSR